MRLAIEDGLDVDDGIVVHEQLRTSQADVYTAGDVANTWHSASDCAWSTGPTPAARARSVLARC